MILIEIKLVIEWVSKLCFTSLIQLSKSGSFSHHCFMVSILLTDGGEFCSSHFSIWLSKITIKVIRTKIITLPWLTVKSPNESHFEGKTKVYFTN